jgi:hypothetical protein
MKRIVAISAFLLGLVALALLFPQFDTANPADVSISREQARAIADREAAKLGVPLKDAWAVTIWEDSPLIDQELQNSPDLRRAAKNDPVIGPRLGGYRTQYFHRTREKFPELGFVVVGPHGETYGARRRFRNERAGANPTAAELRGRADAFIHSRLFPGAPNPQFESARPTVLRSRTDHLFRYRVPSTFNAGKAAFYIGVYFNGNDFAGWLLLEEYADGSQFQPATGSAIADLFGRFLVLLVLLLVFLIIFLKKYHAGEVGVGTGALLFTLVLLTCALHEFFTGAEDSYFTGFGGISAALTALTFSGFRFIFFDLALAVLVFLTWSVGESYARERWGERLASFDAILRRDPVNATVGRSLLLGLAAAPAVAAVGLAIGYIPIAAGLAHPILNDGVRYILSTTGGPLSILSISYLDATVISVVAVLSLLAAFNRRRLVLVGVLVAAVAGTIFTNIGAAPIEPISMKLLFGFGVTIAAIVVFFAYDLLATATALFTAFTILGFVPFLRIASDGALVGPAVAFALPIVLTLGFGLAGMWTRREIVYSYEDLAPHVRRIVERERVKAEIDAANRIQAALLPSEDPVLEGASVSSHYRAASEIGGDYFDFLNLPDGEIGVAFGDVSGHGLTSGIVMAMAKSALLVQVGYDHSPIAVLNVLNDTVMKTAPKRMLMTFFFGVLDPQGQKLRFSSAGHHDPYVYRADNGRIESLSAWGFPLGVRRREPFREYTVHFQPGDRLILYSDGLIEALDDDGEPYGFDRFERVLREAGTKSADDIKKALLQAVKKFTRNRPPEDDQTLVVISFDEARPERLGRTA